MTLDEWAAFKADWKRELELRMVAWEVWKREGHPVLVAMLRAQQPWPFRLWHWLKGRLMFAVAKGGSPR